MGGGEGATDDVGGGDRSGAVSLGLRVKLLEGTQRGIAISVVKPGSSSSLTDSITRRRYFLTADNDCKCRSSMSRRGEYFALACDVLDDTLRFKGLLSSFATSTSVAVNMFVVGDWIAPCRCL